MRFQLYVPSAQMDKWHPEKRSFDVFRSGLIDIAGGLTVQTAFGYWKNGAGSVVAEPVHIVEVVTHPDALFHDAVERFMRAYARDLIQAGEEAVLLVIDNKGELIE